jgi:hypothetical protein
MYFKDIVCEVVVRIKLVEVSVQRLALVVSVIHLPFP